MVVHVVQALRVHENSGDVDHHSGWSWRAGCEGTYYTKASKFQGGRRVLMR